MSFESGYPSRQEAGAAATGASVGTGRGIAEQTADFRTASDWK